MTQNRKIHEVKIQCTAGQSGGYAYLYIQRGDTSQIVNKIITLEQAQIILQGIMQDGFYLIENKIDSGIVLLRLIKSVAVKPPVKPQSLWERYDGYVRKHGTGRYEKRLESMIDYHEDRLWATRLYAA